MDLHRKLELVKTSVDSIATHDHPHTQACLLELSSYVQRCLQEVKAKHEAKLVALAAQTSDVTESNSGAE